MAVALVFKYESGLKIAETDIMWEYLSLTVRLHTGGRYFRCAYCWRIGEHPFFDPYYYVIGHAYCHHCEMWMKIENPQTGREKEGVDSFG